MTYKRKEQIGECTFDNFPKIAVIYAIVGNDVVYVGSTTRQIKDRIRNHISDAKSGSCLPIHKWIRERKYKFHVAFLDVCSSEDRCEIEKDWVSKYKNLLNVTDGGGGLSGHKFAGTEHAKKIADKLKTGKYFNCEKCGKKFWRKQKDIIRNHNKFCSTFCSNTRHKQ